MRNLNIIGLAADVFIGVVFGVIGVTDGPLWLRIMGCAGVVLSVWAVVRSVRASRKQAAAEQAER